MATRKAFSKEDQINVVDWLVQHHPRKENRRGNVVWKLLTEDENARPWNGRHSWQSWRQQYIDNIAHFDILVSKKYRAIHGATADPNNAAPSTPPASKSMAPKRASDKPTASNAKPGVAKSPGRPIILTAPSSSQRPSTQPNANSSGRAHITRDAKALAQYFTDNRINEDIRSRANIFQQLRGNETTATWSRSRSALEWRDFYTDNKEEIDSLVQGVKEGGSTAPETTNPVPRTGKRPREETGEDSVDTQAESSQHPPHVGVNRVKKRRLHGTSTPLSHPEASQSHTPMAVGPGPPNTAVPQQTRTPIILVPETPPLSSREATPNVTSKDSRVTASAFIVKTVASALNHGYSSELGPYGIQGSPIGLAVSAPPSPETPPHRASEHTMQPPKLSMMNGVPRLNGKVPSMHIFPHSLPSLTPALREKMTNREAFFPLDQGDDGRVEADDTTPNTGATRGKTNLPKQSSIFAQVGQETPRGDIADDSRQEIFPHTPPHLTRAPRSGPHSEDQHSINEDSVVFASQREPQNQEASKSLPLEKMDERTPTPEVSQSTLDDNNEFEGPSSMPYLGSDRHSSRSYSFSHGQDDVPAPLLEGLAKDLSNQLIREDAADTEEVDELANDDDGQDENGLNRHPEPRYIVPAKRLRRPSESPLFASSSASEDDGAEKENQGARADQLKATKVGVHYPVKTKVKAKRVVRVRGRRSSDRGMKADEDSAGDGEGDSDKENEAMVGDFNNEFPNDLSPGVEDDPVAPTVVVNYPLTTLQDKMDQTPDFHSSPKPIHFSGETPPSPNITATPIKPQVAPNPASPATAPAKSKDTAAVLKHYERSIPAFVGQDGTKETLLKAALSYPSPNIPSELEEALKRAEEPSPLQRLSERAAFGKGGKDDEHISDTSKSRHGKVRFDGVALDRDRRKTTGETGTSFGAGASRGIVSDTIAGPSGSRFKAAPALFGSQRHSSGRADIGSQDIHIERKGVEVIDLGDGEDEEELDESPLARYSAPSRGASSAHKTQLDQGPANKDGKSSGQGPSRSTAQSSQSGHPAPTRLPPAPPPVRVPIVAFSSSPLPGSSPPARGFGAGRKSEMTSVSTREFGTAMWSPVRFGFGQASGSQDVRGSESLVPLAAHPIGPRQSNPARRSSTDAFGAGFMVEPGQGLSIGFRDQNIDAEWVANVRGRPDITSKRIYPSRRSAPVPSDSEVVVYSSNSRSPSRTRSGSRRRSMRTPTAAGLEDISGVDALAVVSEADKQRILSWLAENRNPNGSSPESDDNELDEATKVFEGLGLMFESMAANNGFAVSVPRNVWKQCGDLSDTAAVVQAMTDAANAVGLEALETRQKETIQKAMDMRETMLSGEVDGRRRSGRYSVGDGRGDAGITFSGDVPSSMRDSGGANDMSGRGNRTSRSKSRDGRRPRPPSYVPAEVIEPLLPEPSQ